MRGQLCSAERAQPAPIGVSHCRVHEQHVHSVDPFGPRRDTVIRAGTQHLLLDGGQFAFAALHCLWLIRSGHAK